MLKAMCDLCNCEVDSAKIPQDSNIKYFKLNYVTADKNEDHEMDICYSCMNRIVESVELLKKIEEDKYMFYENGRLEPYILKKRTFDKAAQLLGEKLSGIKFGGG